MCQRACAGWRAAGCQPDADLSKPGALKVHCQAECAVAWVFGRALVILCVSITDGLSDSTAGCLRVTEPTGQGPWRGQARGR